MDTTCIVCTHLHRRWSSLRLASFFFCSTPSFLMLMLIPKPTPTLMLILMLILMIILLLILTLILMLGVMLTTILTPTQPKA